MNFATSDFSIHLADRICRLGTWFNEMTATGSIPLHCAWILLDVLLVVFLIRGIVKRHDWLIPASLILPAAVANVIHFMPLSYINVPYIKTTMFIALILMAILTAFYSGRSEKHSELFLCIFVVLMVPILFAIFATSGNSISINVLSVRSILIVQMFFLPIVLVWNLVNFIIRIQQKDHKTILINTLILLGVCYNVFFWCILKNTYEVLMA